MPSKNVWNLIFRSRCICNVVVILSVAFLNPGLLNKSVTNSDISQTPLLELTIVSSYESLQLLGRLNSQTFD